MLKRLMLAAALCLGLPAQAQEQIVLRVPDGFALAFEQIDAEGAIREYVPADQTSEDWRQMVTVTNTLNSRGMSAPVFADIFLQSAGGSCPDFAGGIEFEAEQNGFPFVIVALQCPTSFDGSALTETAFVKIVVTPARIYTFQYAWRGEQPIETQQKFMNWTVPQTVCIAGSAAHPCPT